MKYVKQKKHCFLCGSDSHTLATCPLPGAKKCREWKRKEKNTPRKANSRTLRGNGPAAARKPGKCSQVVQKRIGKKKVSAAAFKKKQRRSYSGDAVDHSKRSDRQQSLPDTSKLLSPDEACKALLAAGYMQPLEKCNNCNVGTLHGLFSRPGRCLEHRYYRCDYWSCRSYTNALTGRTWLDECHKFKALTPARLYLIISAYTSKMNPTRKDCCIAGCQDKQIQFVLDKLRDLEAQAAMSEASSLELSGHIEVDATSLRSFRVGPRSHAFASEIKERCLSCLCLFLLGFNILWV